MFPFKIFRVRGVDVRVDPSFVVVALFFVWMLATSFFPDSYPELDGEAFWWMGVAACIGLAASLIWHELAHALIARRYGVDVQSVSLFLLGGVAELSEEPKTPRAELTVALAGPLTSLLLASAFLALASLNGLLGGQAPVTAVLEYLGWLNVLLALFNLLPAFPLDGGRVLRALLWRSGCSLGASTEIAAGLGKAFGIIFIVTGVLFILAGSFVTGAWWALIGMFLRQAALRAMSTLVARETLAGEPVARFLRPVNVAVPTTTTLHAFLFDFVYRFRERCFPVVDAATARFVGVARARDLGRVGRARYKMWNVTSILEHASDKNALPVEADAAVALQRMGAIHSDRIYIVESGELRGVVLAADLMDFVNLKLEVDGPATDATYDARALHEAAGRDTRVRSGPVPPPLPTHA